jgi:hypothetical protein
MLNRLITTLRKRGAQGRSFPVQAAEATQAAEIISDLLRQRDALLEAAIKTIEENPDLANEEACTLKHLKRGIEVVTEGGAT